MTSYASKTHTYRGHTIYPCERAAGEHAGRWVVQTYHPTGLPHADELCPHAYTLEEARRIIWEAVRDEARREFRAHC